MMLAGSAGSRKIKMILHRIINRTALFIASYLLLCISCNGNVCPNKEIDCQVYLQQGQKSPYRNVTAPYTGWHFAGHAEIEACYVGPPKMCKICSDSEQKRKALCASLYPGYTIKPGLAIPLDK